MSKEELRATRAFNIRQIRSCLNDMNQDCYPKNIQRHTPLLKKIEEELLQAWEQDYGEAFDQ